MKTTAVVLLATVLTALLSLPAASQDPLWQVQRITSTSWTEYGPKIWGDTVYYGENRNGYGEIYSWDQAQGPRKLLGGDGIHRSVLDVYGDKLVIGHYSDGNRDVYLYDPVNGERFVGTGRTDASDARIYGDTVVWVKGGRIQVWDPVNGNRILYDQGSGQSQPRIWGDRIMWYMWGTYPYYDDRGIYMWTPGSEVTKVFGSWDYFDMYEDKVAMWESAFWLYPPAQPGIYFPGSLCMWTPTGSQLIQHDFWTRDLEMWGDLVVSNARTWDPIHGFTCYADRQAYWVDSFSVYGNKIVWAAEGAERRGDIYLSTMIPEPSSLIALLTGFGPLGILLVRRRPSDH